MKQTVANSRLSTKEFRTLFLLFFSLAIFTFYSCKSKSSTVTLTPQDSLAIAKKVVARVERIYYLKFPVAKQMAVFNANNNVKQIHFSWISYPGDIWGLEAYGVDDKGKAITAKIPLDPITTITPMPNYWRDKTQPQVWKRGGLKDLLNLGTLRQNVIIRDNEFQDLYFTPSPDPYSEESNSTFYYITTEQQIVLGPTKMKIAGKQGYSNPSPPANSACIDCDNPY